MDSLENEKTGIKSEENIENKEYNAVFQKYAFDEISCIGDIDFKLLARIVQEVESFERPDSYCAVGDIAYIIEHFEFDSYHNNKKGSEYRNEEASDLRDLKKLCGINGEASLHTMIKSSSSFADYVDNFIKHFDNHYKNIEEYKNNIKSRCPFITKFKIWFFIEDVDPIAPMVNNQRICCMAHPLNFKRIRDYLSDKKEVDGIVIGVNSGEGTTRMLFIKNDHFDDDNIETFEENERIFCTNCEKIISMIRNN